MKRVYGTPGTAPDGKSRSSSMAGDDIADRVQWVSNTFESMGKPFTVTEIWRPVGVPADRDVKYAEDTSTGGFNQYYAKGVQDRGGPNAATPGLSDHGKTGWGEGAADTSVNQEDMALRTGLMAAVGMIQTDRTETWHHAIRGDPAAWWDRTKVNYPEQDATPAPAKPAATNFQEIIMGILVQQSDDKRKIFLIDGGAEWIDGDTLNAHQELNKAAGLPDAGFYTPIQMPSAKITRISESIRRANGSYIVRDAVLKAIRDIQGADIDEVKLGKAIGEAILPTVRVALADLEKDLPFTAEDIADVFATRLAKP